MDLVQAKPWNNVITYFPILCLIFHCNYRRLIVNWGTKKNTVLFSLVVLKNFIAFLANSHKTPIESADHFSLLLFSPPPFHSFFFFLLYLTLPYIALPYLPCQFLPLWHVYEFILSRRVCSWSTQTVLGLLSSPWCVCVCAHGRVCAYAWLENKIRNWKLNQNHDL